MIIIVFIIITIIMTTTQSLAIPDSNIITILLISTIKISIIVKPTLNGIQ